MLAYKDPAFFQVKGLSLPETNSSHLKIDGWKTIRLHFGFWPTSRGEPYVLGRVSSKKDVSNEKNPSCRVFFWGGMKFPTQLW